MYARLLSGIFVFILSWQYVTSKHEIYLLFPEFNQQPTTCYVSPRLQGLSFSKLLGPKDHIGGFLCYFDLRVW